MNNINQKYIKAILEVLRKNQVINQTTFDNTIKEIEQRKVLEEVA